MKKITLLLLALIIALTLGTHVLAADATGKGATQTLCPLMNGPIDKKVYTDYEGKRIYFCCAGCIDDFKKDPAKYLKKMEEQGVVLEKSPSGQ